MMLLVRGVFINFVISIGYICDFILFLFENCGKNIFGYINILILGKCKCKCDFYVFVGYVYLFVYFFWKE